MGNFESKPQTLQVSQAIVGTTGVTGQTVYEYVISNGEVQVTCLSYGATITSIRVPDRCGKAEEITLCYKTVEELKANPGPYYGCIAGRYANRIKEGTFTVEGKAYRLPINNGPNSLHGGLEGFDKKIWVTKAVVQEDRAGVIFEYTSPDGEEGYPGELKVRVSYLLTAASELVIDYSATTTKATPVNLTNHTYWNLSGDFRQNVYQQQLYLSCSRYLPVDATRIPTGELNSVQDTPFDFTTTYRGDATATAGNGRPLGEAIPNIDGGGRPGIDHCFIVSPAAAPATPIPIPHNTTDSNSNSSSVVSVSSCVPDSSFSAAPIVKHVATLTDEASGRQLILHASQPGVQVYTANWLSEQASDAPHIQHNAVCLETQHFPDSPNQTEFPDTILRPGKEYRHRAIFAFKTIPL